MPKFGSKKAEVITYDDGVELHTKYMFCNDVLTEVRRSFRGQDGTSISHTHVLQSWFQPVHKHLRTTEATTVLAGCALSISFNEDGCYKAVLYEAGSVISDEVGVRHTLYVTAGTKLSTSKVKTGQPDDKPDWYGDPECDQELENVTIERILAANRIDLPAHF